MGGSQKLQINHQLIAVVVDDGDLVGFEVEGTRLVGRHIDDAESALLEHTLEVTVALAKGQRLGAVVVGDVNGGALALLVVVVGALVLIELECAIAAGIDIQRDVSGRTLVAILHLRAIRDDATLADIDGDALVGSVDDEPAAREVRGER